jgi:hypothetical protein
MIPEMKGRELMVFSLLHAYMEILAGIKGAVPP